MARFLRRSDRRRRRVVSPRFRGDGIAVRSCVLEGTENLLSSHRDLPGSSSLCSRRNCPLQSRHLWVALAEWLPLLDASPFRLSESDFLPRLCADQLVGPFSHGLPHFLRNRIAGLDHWTNDTAKKCTCCFAATLTAACFLRRSHRRADCRFPPCLFFSDGSLSTPIARRHSGYRRLHCRFAFRRAMALP